MNITVADVPDKERFEARDEAGTLAGVLTYQVTGNVIAYTHTRVEAEFESHGVGSALARAAMEDALAKGRLVVPICPFLTSWLDEHQQYEKIVARSTKRVK